MVCTIKEWHPTTRWVDSEETEARRFQKLESDLFKPYKCDVSAPQKETMSRNYAASPLFRLPPKIRVRIYGLVLDGMQLWIAHSESKVELEKPEKNSQPQGPQSAQYGHYRHRCGRSYQSTADSFPRTKPSINVLHLGLSRVCGQVYTETALLPFTLNTFTFSDDLVRREFEQTARPGEKRVQKNAVGKYEIGAKENPAVVPFQSTHELQNNEIMNMVVLSG
ncbi:hypothetical protein HO133_006111 [Letharia lupina]|uniref:DUF7730 domain-containing protein n=1 Tax=Letharia lupina TaxID=560253 RepID=A0A8H6F7I3_9LECA|nr:uncharacterized protein HO133_006111 [Letharia lupina]KAF6218152.1 hypothetical protein HO133_006111 [Letharia lupina]